MKFMPVADDGRLLDRNSCAIPLGGLETMDQKPVRIAAAFGALYVLAGVVASGGKGDQSAPSLGASGDSVAGYAASHAFGAVMIGQVLEILSLLALLVFAAALYTILRRAERDPGPLPVLAFGGGMLAVGLKLASLMPAFALHYHSQPIDPAVARALFEMNEFGFVLTWFGQALLLGAVAVAGLTSRAVPLWLAVPAGLIALGLVVDAAFATNPTAPFIPELMWLMWVLIASVRLTVRVSPIHARQMAASSATV